jgi:mono/diheme cytochrome c family protein
VTEIPEHLLKRSRERRQAMGLPGGEAPASAPAGQETPATPSTAVAKKAAAPAPAPRAAAPAPKPVPPYVQAAQRRRKIPIWAVPVVGLLPLWAFLYWGALQTPDTKVEGPLAAGATVYNSCSSCHGGAGEGGVGYPLSGGSVLRTFPKIEDQMKFIYLGTAGYIGRPYGNPAVGRIGGARGQMPTWKGQLTDVEILEVACHERFTLSGEDQSTDEYTKWCSPDGENYVKVRDGGFAAVGLDVNTA